MARLSRAERIAAKKAAAAASADLEGPHAVTRVPVGPATGTSAKQKKAEKPNARKIVQPQMKTVTKRGGGLNLQNTLAYISQCNLNQLDGVHDLLVSKLGQLKAKPNPKAAAAAEKWTGAGIPTGNVRGVIAFVNGSDASDVPTLQCLEAVIRNRFDAAGYKPTLASSLT